MGVWRCWRCKRVTVSDPEMPDGTERLDPALCMECIFDDEEHIVRGDS